MSKVDSTTGDRERSRKLKDAQWPEYLEQLLDIIDPSRRPKHVEKLSTKEQIAWMTERVDHVLDGLSRPLTIIITGLMRPGDCGRSPLERPDWLDMSKFVKGQKFAENNCFAMFTGVLLGIVIAYSYIDNIRPILITGKSSTLYDSLYRYLKNADSMIITFKENPWEEGTNAHKNVQAIRKAHAAVRAKCAKLSPEEVQKKCRIERAWCPARRVLIKDFRESCPEVDPRTRPYVFLNDKSVTPTYISQMEMHVTQLVFMGLLVAHPEYFGITATEEELEAFCHYWRGMGYLFGIEDEYNLCNGSLEEIRAGVAALVECHIKPNLREIPREWEHLIRCFVEGTGLYMPLITFESSLLYVCDVLNIRLTRFRASIGYIHWFRYKMMQYYFFYASKLPIVVRYMNKLVRDKVYRLLNCTEEMTRELKEKSDKIMSSIPMCD